MDNPFLHSPIDRAFNHAFDHFLRINGLSALSFCRRTGKLSPDGHKLILPTQVTKWRRDQMPSARAVMIAAETFGVPRSFFYLAGELIESGRAPEDAADRVSQQLAMLLAAIEGAGEKDLLVLEAAIRERRFQLAADKES